MSALLERLKALLPISEALASQDNRCTDQPMFLVRQKKRTYGFDPAYSDKVVWLDRENDCAAADADEHARLEAAWNNGEGEPHGWTRTAYQDTDEYVTACFTEKGAESYIARNGHNLSLPSVYADDGSYRNNEWREVRQLLLDLPGLLQDPGAEVERLTEELDAARSELGNLRHRMINLSKTLDRDAAASSFARKMDLLKCAKDIRRNLPDEDPEVEPVAAPQPARVPDQPPPAAERTDQPSVWDLVIEDMTCPRWTRSGDGLVGIYRWLLSHLPRLASAAGSNDVLADMRERDRVGRARYGTPLQPFNGRKPLVDAYQEALDLVVYLRQHLCERGGRS